MEHTPNEQLYTDKNGQAWQVCTNCRQFRKAAKLGFGKWTLGRTCDEIYPRPEPVESSPRPIVDLINDLFEQT